MNKKKGRPRPGMTGTRGENSGEKHGLLILKREGGRNKGRAPPSQGKKRKGRPI